MGTLTHVSTQAPVAALTFDDGPHPDYTPALLDILEKYHARATFFCIGMFAQKHWNIVQRAAEAGHAIGNHSWDHPSLPLLGFLARIKQLRRCSDVLAPYGQRLFRPPYGHQTVGSRLVALRLGYRVIGWSVVAYDWLDHDAKWLADRVVSQIQPGSIVLLHDRLFTAADQRYFNREKTLGAVQQILEHCGDRFRFVTVPELLQLGKPQRQNWYWEPNLDWLKKVRDEQGKRLWCADGAAHQ